MTEVLLMVKPIDEFRKRPGVLSSSSKPNQMYLYSRTVPGTYLTWRMVNRMTALMCFVLGCVMLQAPPVPSEVQQLIKKITPALVSDDNVKLRLRLAKITFDFTGTGKNPTTLLDILAKLNGGRFLFEIANPEFRIHFDRWDVAWLRAYCHLLCAMVDGYRAVDLEAEFAKRVAGVFPKVEPAPEATDPPGSAWFKLDMADPTRLRRMRLHLLAVCKLTPETWLHIRSETDDDYEWLSHPKQTDQLNLPLTDERIDGWLAAMEQLEWLLEGESLISPLMLGPAMEIHAKKGLALSLRKTLDDPPVDLLNYEHFTSHGIDERYFEPAKDKKEFAMPAISSLLQLFQDPFSFAYAARLN